MLEWKSVKPGDLVIGLASNGLHTNGYSLARKILFDQLKLTCKTCLPETGNTLGDELLRVHLSYGLLIQQLLRKFNPPSAPIRRGAIKAIAHITGGGFVDNIPRMLPDNCDVLIREGTWQMPPVFRLLQEKGGVSQHELYQVFNMGIGMTLIVEAKRAMQILKEIHARKYKGFLIGTVEKGTGLARVK